jgi:hypothetical protein
MAMAVELSATGGKALVFCAEARENSAATSAAKKIICFIVSSSLRVS